MKATNTIFLALVAALIPLQGWCAVETTATGALPPPTTSVDATSNLSRSSKDVVKMSVSGVSDDVIKAYINNSGSTYNLTPDNIIHLQGVGVSAAVTSEMLAHDLQLRAQANVPPPTAPNMAQQPYANMPQDASQNVQPQNSVSTYTIPSEDPYYSSLSSYGSWDYSPSYGWCWAPSYGYSYAYYPWGLLRGGRWWNSPGRGWVWFPGSRFGPGLGAGRGFGVGFGGRGFGFGVGAGFGARNNFRNVGTFGFRGGTGFRTASAGFSRSSGSHFGGSAGFSHGSSFGHSSFGGGGHGGGHR